MLGDIRFSAPGDAPTTFEIQLLMTAGPQSWPAQLAQRMATRLGPALAAEMLVLVLDEIGNERIDVPTRRNFFRSLWCKDRDRLIAELAQPGRGFTKSEIASMLGVRRQHVNRVLHGKPRRRTGKSASGKPRP